MSDGVHLLIPFAACQAPGFAEQARALALPHLEKLLSRMGAPTATAQEPDSLCMPHERVIAAAHGIDAPDGQLPLAALHVESTGRDTQGAAWAWIMPCHWRVGTDHVAMAAPAEWTLDEADSRAAFEAVRPWFTQDGVHLHYEEPARWLAHGEIFRGLATASFDRVAGQVVDPWLPRTDEARPIRRLQQEMQMLLYTHPLNDERARRGLLPVNSFWVSGTGALPASRRRAPAGELRVCAALRAPALQGDAAAWAEAWRQLDATTLRELAQSAPPGLTLSLAGGRAARTWAASRGGALQRLGQLFGRTRAADVLETL